MFDDWEEKCLSFINHKKKFSVSGQFISLLVSFNLGRKHGASTYIDCSKDYRWPFFMVRAILIFTNRAQVFLRIQYFKIQKLEAVTNGESCRKFMRYLLIFEVSWAYFHSEYKPHPNSIFTKIIFNFKPFSKYFFFIELISVPIR